MHKIINFLKNNYFIKGLISVLMGFMIFWIRGGLLSKSNVAVGYGYLKFIGEIFWVISLLFFIISAAKEKLIFKIISAICIFLVLVLLISSIIVEIKYAVFQYQFTDATEQYSSCVREWNISQNSENLIECLNKIFQGKTIFVK